MNRVSLDTIGIAGFGHNFGALDGEYGAVEESLAKMSVVPPRGPINNILQLMGPLLPALSHIPTKRNVYLKRLHNSMQGVAQNLLQKTKEDGETGSFSDFSRSIMGALGETTDIC